MNEEAFNTMYTLAQKEGYEKTPEEFKTLLSSNEEALNIMYSLAQKEGYEKPVDEFKTLLGVSSVEGKDGNFTNASSEPSGEATREQSKVGTPSPSKTISFADFEVENPIDTTIDVSTIDISKYNKQYKPRTSETNFSKMEEMPSTPIGGIKGATIGYNAGIVDGNTTLSPIVEQELPVGIINKNKVLPYKKKVDKTKVGTPNPSLLGSVRGAAIGSKAGIVEGNKTTVGTPSPYDIRKNSVKLEGQESPSTVLMESGGYDGKEYAYPTLFPKDPNKQTSDPKDWIRLEGGEAFDEAKKRKEVWEFDSQEEADKFARGSWKKEYKPRASEINFPKMEEIPSMKDGITQNVRDVFTPANTTTTKPIIKEEKIKKISEVAKNIDNEEDYSMFTESLSYIDGLLNSTIAESDKFRLRGSAAFEEIGDMILEKEEQRQKYASQNKKYSVNFISNIPSYVKRVLIQYGYKDQEVDESSITQFRGVERQTQPVDISQTNNETVQDTIPTYTQIFPKVKDNFWRSTANVDLKGNKKDSDIEYNLNVFRNEFDAVNGFTYAPIPSNGNTEAPEKLEGVSGVAHFFIRDGRPKEFKDVYDATNEDLKKESEWFKKGGYSDKDGYDISNFKKLKKDQYVPVFNKTESGDLRISYKKKGDVTENDYVTQNLKQYNYGDINWKKTTTDKQYGKEIQVLSTTDGKSIPSLPVLGGVTADGKAVKGQELYSRFSGSATVFLFEKDGKLIADDFSGSANNIKAEAERLSKDYDVPLKDITLAFYDAGSYSAKPAENSNGVLDRRQWVDYNVKLESGSGIGFKK